MMGTFGRVILVVLVSALGLEIALRLDSNKVDVFEFKNYARTQKDLYQRAYPAQFDPDLGYIPKPGDHGKQNVWQTQVEILEPGIRSNGRPPVQGDRPILAVGDSFTFGDQVSDHETWPAYLEQALAQPVINGGVFGYGIDQTVLFTERLAALFDPTIILFSFVADDIQRAEYSMRNGVPKPYFEIENGQLVRRQDPVPNKRFGDIKQEGEISAAIRNALGYSYLLNKLFQRLGMSAWWYAGYAGSERVHGDGPEVSCLLLDRLAELRAPDRQVYIIAQYMPREVKRDERHELVRDFLDCARERDFPIIDTFDPIHEYRNTSEDKPGLYWGHMTSAGNAFVAELIARKIQ